jgi:hypothetical protein
MKKLLLCLAMISVFVLQVTSYAAEELLESVKQDIKGSIIMRVYCGQVYINNEVKNIDDNNTKPYLNNGRTMVPLRFISENLGCSVKWQAENQLIVLSSSDKTIKLNLNKSEMYINDKMVWLDAAPEIKNDRTYVPLRAISEALNKKVYFNSDTIIISDKDMNTFGYTQYIINFAISNLKTDKDTYIASVSNLSIKELSKNPNKYKDYKVTYRGKVIEIYERDVDGQTITFMRLKIVRGTSENVILVTMLGSYPIYENSSITIYGEVVGTFDYISQYGLDVSIPMIHAWYYL